MSQSPGCSSGDLELLGSLKQVKEEIRELTDQTHNIAGNRSINFIMTAGTKTFVDKVRISGNAIVIPAIEINANTTLPYITINGTAYNILGKIDNENPLNMNANTSISNSALYLELDEANNRWNIRGINVVYIYYDGCNTCLISYMPRGQVVGNAKILITSTTIIFNSTGL